MRRLLLAMILCMPSAASAASLGMPSEGFVYFHHAGSDMAAHNAAVEACAGSAAPTIGPMAANFGGVLGAWIADSENNGLAHVTFVANLENCMVARGWEVVRVADDEGRNLAALGSAQLAAALAPWVGAPQPHGTVVRRYEPIDGLSPNAAGYGDRAANSLSFSADLDNIKARSAVPAPAMPTTGFQQIMETKNLTEVPAGSSVVVFRMFATNPPNIGMLFLRDRDGATPPMLFKANSPTHFLWHDSLLEQTYAFVVPPGRWHMAEVRFTSFCLGGPAFDLAPGEALFAGSFDAQKPFAPDMALEPAQKALGDTALAKQLKPARYSNGASFACDAVPANTIYVLEYPGLAFDKDYASGSRAPK